MNPHLELLRELHDIDSIIAEAEKEAQDPALNEAGLRVDPERLEALKAHREEIASKLPDKILRRYERLRARYGRGIAPVVGGICTACFAQLPTAMISDPQRNEKVDSCPSCGVFIYWTQ